MYEGTTEVLGDINGTNLYADSKNVNFNKSNKTPNKNFNFQPNVPISQRRGPQKVSPDNIIKDMKNLDINMRGLQEDIYNINSPILKLLETGQLAISPKGLDKLGNTSILNPSASVTDSLTGLPIGQLIKEGISDRMHTISSLQSSGANKQLCDNRHNEWVMANLPSVAKSLDLFVDCVCNGEMFGENTRDRIFRFKNNNVEVDNANDIREAMQLLEPEVFEADTQGIRRVSDMDYEAAWYTRRDGNAVLHPISHTKAAKDMFIKYVMAKSKAKREKNKKEKQQASLSGLHQAGGKSQSDVLVGVESIIQNVTNPESYVRVINNEDYLKIIKDYIHNIGIESDDITCETNLLHILNPKQIAKLPKALITVSEELNIDAIKNPENHLNQKIKTKTQDEIELDLLNESFEDFAYRYVKYQGAYGYSSENFIEALHGMESQQLSTVQMYEEIEKINKSTVNGMDNFFTFGYNRLPEDVYTNILHSMFGGKIVNQNKLEKEVQYGLESCIADLSKNDEKKYAILDNYSFDDIYNINTSRINNLLENEEEYFSLESIVDFKTNIGVYDPLLNLYTDVLLGGDYGLDSIGLETLNEQNGDALKIAGMENFGSTAFNGPHSLQTPSNFNSEIGSYQGYQMSDSKIKELKENKVIQNRVEKMFHNLKGETTRRLDPTKTIKLMVGNKLLGVFDIEYTHEERLHLISVRSIMNAPTTYMRNMDIFNVREEDAQETVGRLMFSDVIKNVLERNIDTKFIRDNADIIQTLNKLMEERNLSNDMGNEYIDYSRGTVYNLAKINFIPAAELVFYRRGNGLGKSVFDIASVSMDAAILARESYLSYLLVDGKQITLIDIPQGLSYGYGGYNESHVASMLMDKRLTRARLKEVPNAAGQNMGRDIFCFISPPDIQKQIEVKTIEPGEFTIDIEIIRQWEEDACNAVGFPKSSFTALDGTVELARKISDINASKALEIQHDQKWKTPATNELATKLLRMRGGDKYKNWTVEWVPPKIARLNVQKLDEVIKEKTDALENIIKAMPYCNSELANLDDTDPLKAKVIQLIAEELFEGDKYLGKIASLIDEAKAKVKEDIATKTEETI